MKSEYFGWVGKLNLSILSRVSCATFGMDVFCIFQVKINLKHNLHKIKYEGVLINK